jgi:glutamate racemase
MGTTGTVNSGSYPMEIQKLFPTIKVFQQACPMWVPLVESNEHLSLGAEYFVEKYVNNLLEQDNEIDTIVLACTHYPLLVPVIQKFLPPTTRLVPQGDIVADKLQDYLYRHPEIEVQISKNANREFCTTDSTEIFDRHASIFYGEEVSSSTIILQ